MMSGYHRPRRQNSHQQSYGVPPYDTASQGQTSSGFEDFSALQDPTIYEDTWLPAGPGPQLDPLHRSPITNTHPGYTTSFPQHNVVAGSSHSSHYSQYPYYPQPTTAIRGPQSPVNASGYQNAYATDPSVSLTSPSYVSSGYGIAPPPELPYAASAASSTTSQPEEEEGLKPTADEEKRKRNLAASARFRQKKKLREQQLEQATRELSERAAELEDRIAELEQENQLLKAMLTEKEENMTEEDKRRFRQIASQMEDDY